MKFRALNLDYHGDATLQWAENENERRPRGEKSDAFILLRKDCYEKEEKKMTPVERSEPKIDRTETVGQITEASPLKQTIVLPAVDNGLAENTASKYDLENCLDIPSTKATAPFWNEHGSDCTSSEPDDLAPIVLTYNNAENMSEAVFDHVDLQNKVSRKADEKCPHCELPKVAPLRINAKAKYRLPLLSWNELNNVLRRLYNVSKTVRLAKEPWHDCLPQHFRFRLFWHEPRGFLRAHCSNQEGAGTLFQNRSSMSLSQISKCIKTIAVNLGHHLRIREDVGSASHVQSPYSFSLLEMLRDDAGTFGLRRLKKSACRHQLDAERGAIVPYIGPHTRHNQETKIIPPPELMLAVQIALAVMRQQNHAVARNQACEQGDTTITDAIDLATNAKRVQDEQNGDGGCISFTAPLQKNKKRPRESALFSPSRGRSSSSLQVSFEYFPSDQEGNTVRSATAPVFGRITASSSTERVCKTQHEANVPGDEPVEIDQTSARAKKNKKRTAEQKAERKKQKRERKARKQAKTRDEKRTCSESADSNTLQSAKRLKTGVFDAECKLPADSPKRPGTLPRSVVSKRSPSRRVSVADGRSEFEKTRAVLNNIKHENRSAFSQMKIPRSTLAHSGATNTANDFFKWSTNAPEQKGIRGPLQGAVAAVGKHVHESRAGDENASAGYSDSRLQKPTGCQALGAIAQNLGFEEFCRQQPENRSLHVVKSNHSNGYSSSLYSTAVHGRPETQRQELAYNEILADSARRPHQAIAPLAIGDKHYQLHASETTHGASAGVRNVALDGATPLSLPCSEPFLESWSDIVAELASGLWQQHHSNATTAVENAIGIRAPGRRINLVDSPLLNACGVDIEAPGRSGLVIHSVSALEAAVDAKAIVLAIATLAAIGRYKNIYIFLSYDTEITSSIAKHLTQLQCATILSNGLPETTVTIKTTLPSTLSFSLAQTIFSLSERGGTQPLKNSIIEGVSDSRMLERSRFLLSLIPVLSASGSIETLLLAKQSLPNGSPYFRLLFQNARLRQKIMLAASANSSTEVHPDAMVQLSNILPL